MEAEFGWNQGRPPSLMFKRIVSSALGIDLEWVFTTFSLESSFDPRGSVWAELGAVIRPPC
jgi:hypothetical protein